MRRRRHCRASARRRWSAYFTSRTSFKSFTACGPSSAASWSWIGCAALMNPALSTFSTTFTQMHGLRAVGREQRVFRLGRLHAHFLAFDVVDRFHFLLAVHVAHAHGEQAEHLSALHLILDHGAEFRGNRRVGECPGQVLLVAKDEVQREYARLRRE